MPELTKIKTIDMRLIEDLFEMGSGYVLDFSNKTFSEFFDDELGINIDDPCYELEGTSKAKRLRYFLKTSGQATRLKTLKALWEYREANRRRISAEDRFPNAEREFYSLLERLGGNKPVEPAKREPFQARTSIDPRISVLLRDRLIHLSNLQPQQRGFAFEKFLTELFEINGLMPRASFRLVGEQIDGSFELSSETYLLEAKWTNTPIGVSDLHSFQGKIEQKAAWSRGIFISESGFSEEGLKAFGRGKKIICMDGLDLYEMLDRNIAFADVVSRKVRRAAESGNPFVRVRDIF